MAGMQSNLHSQGVTVVHHGSLIFDPARTGGSKSGDCRGKGSSALSHTVEYKMADDVTALHVWSVAATEKNNPEVVHRS